MFMEITILSGVVHCHNRSSCLVRGVENKLINEYQSGYLPNHSTTAQLVEIYHRIAYNIEHNDATSIIFADMSRAFDKLSHKGLKCKLNQYGLSLSLSNWIMNFLGNRRQRTMVNGRSPLRMKTKKKY